MHDDALLLLQNARKMHQLMLARFSSPDRVRQYTDILKQGVGEGVYASHEKKVFQPIIDLFPTSMDIECNLTDNESDDDDDPTYSVHNNTPNRKKRSMKEIVQELQNNASIAYQAVDQFPPSRKCSRFPRARVSLNTECFLSIRSRKVYVRLVQVLRCRNDPSKLIYVLKSPMGLVPGYYGTMSEDEFFHHLSTGDVATFTLPTGETSSSTLSTDIFNYSSASDVDPNSIKTYPFRFFASSLAKKHSLEMFFQQIKSHHFVQKQRLFFGSLLDFMNTCSFYTEQHSQRVGWANWVPAKNNERWFSWQIVALLLLTNSVHDKVVSDISMQMFRKYDNPIEVASNPSLFIDFFTSKAKNFHPLTENFDCTSDGMTKAPNYCNQKAAYIVAMSKIVILRWCIKNEPSCHESLDNLISKYADHRSMVSLSQPIPSKWLNAVRCSSDTLFPSNYDPDFFKSLPGIGLKMQHLSSETLYSAPLGPAIDCHCIRFSVEFGCVHASMNIEHMNTALTTIFKDEHYIALNEVPATISQVLTAPRITVTPDDDKDTAPFLDALMNIARLHGMGSCMSGFLSHYTNKSLL